MNEKVKQALELLEYLRTSTLETDVDSMGGLVQTNESCFENEINELKDIVKDFDKYHESQQDLIKGKDEYIAKLCNDRAELKEEIKRLDNQYKNIHNTKVKIPLCNILNGLSRSEREKVIEDIYYSQAERQDFYDNKISKLENELTELREFAKVISRSVEVNELGSTDAYYNTANVINKDTIVNEDVTLVKKVVEKYGK